MRSKVYTRVLCRLGATLAVVLPLLVATAAPAAAAAPSNDEIGNATVITSLPFHETVDMSQATWNPLTDSASCNRFNQVQSVWYTFTPTSSGQVAFDPSPSNQIMVIDVYTGSPGALNFVGCGSGGAGGFNEGGFILDATAGTTYSIMASPICCVPVPILDLSVYVAVPPQATLSVNGGTFDLGGNATIAGTLDCVGTVVADFFHPAVLIGSVRQSVGRLSSVSASFSMTPTCAGATGWTALAQPATGRFVGGPATVNASARLCNLAGCATPSTTVVIKLT
jgi:hypothetical protein